MNDVYWLVMQVMWTNWWNQNTWKKMQYHNNEQLPHTIYNNQWPPYKWIYVGTQRGIYMKTNGDYISESSPLRSDGSQYSQTGGWATWPVAKRNSRGALGSSTPIRWFSWWSGSSRTLRSDGSCGSLAGGCYLLGGQRRPNESWNSRQPKDLGCQSQVHVQ